MSNESSSLPAVVDFTVWRGDTFRRALTVTNDAESAWDFTGAAVKLYIRDTQESDALITLEEAPGLEIALNVITIELSAAQTNTLKARSYLYEVEYTSAGGDTRTWLAGKLILKDKPE